MWDLDDIEAMQVPNDERPPDPQQKKARERLRFLFSENPKQVFFSRQLEVLLEGEFFHWVTSRAVHELVAEGLVLSEVRTLRWGNQIALFWHRGYRYYRRGATAVAQLVEEYSDPNIGGALGLQGEAMVLEGLARRQFVMIGRKVQEYKGRQWAESGHDLDFAFERDGRAYGIEVKNTLGYPDYDEFKLKTELATELGLVPMWCSRMLPKSWVNELNKVGGFALILKYQLYPWGHRELARRVADELGLPVDAPRSLAEGTMDRFVQWHLARL